MIDDAGRCLECGAVPQTTAGHQCDKRPEPPAEVWLMHGLNTGRRRLGEPHSLAVTYVPRAKLEAAEEMSRDLADANERMRLQVVEAQRERDDAIELGEAAEAKLAEREEWLQSVIAENNRGIKNLKAKLAEVEAERDQERKSKGVLVEKVMTQAHRTETLTAALRKAITAIDALPQDALGVDGDLATGETWPIRDALIHNLEAALKETESTDGD